MNNVYFIVSAVVVVGASVFAGLLLWALGFMRYEVAAPYFLITWLGLPVRRIPLDDIKFISTKPVFLSEPWYNTARASTRLLVIHRHTGRCKALAITPRNRFMLRAELLHARDGTNPLAPEMAMPGAPLGSLIIPKPAGSSSSKSAKDAA